MAVHDGTQTDDLGEVNQEAQPGPAMLGTPAQGACPTMSFTASELGLCQDCMEPLPNLPQPTEGNDARPMEHWRGWLGLQHATETQAQAALGSLDLNAVGEPTLPMGAANGDLEQDSLGPTLPWNPPPIGGNSGGAARTTQVDLDPDSADHSESQESHRRRRAHAACD